MTSRDQSIRVALIGSGIMGSDHARIITDDIPDASLQVICDTSDASARALSQRHAVSHVETDPFKTIQQRDVDAVIIASPDHTHAEYVLAAIAAHKPVLCEKPLAPESEECLRVLDAEMAVGRMLVQVGFMRRFDPAYVQMKSAFSTGAIGDALMMHNFHRNVEAPSKNFSGMMAITNSAPHEFDIVRYVLEEEVVSVTAFEPDKTTVGECKPVVMVLGTSGGQLITIEVNNIASYGYDVRAELVGTGGAVSLNDSVPIRVDKSLSSSFAYAQDWRPRFAEAYRLQDKAWIASIRSGVAAPLASNAWDGYCASVIAEAGAKSLATGSRESIEIIEQPAFYCHSGTRP